jgi:hypothetical protein
MTHDITEGRIEAVAMAIYDLEIWKKPRNARDIAHAALEADARWLAEQPPIKRVPDGPPCPTCGFRIVNVERKPFNLEIDDD